jgi:RIO-like serine/threonine protein kinase
MSEQASVERLKHDHFGSISRVVDADGRACARRDTREASFGLRWIARRVARREARALEALHGTEGVPALLAFDGRVLDREWLAGAPMQDAQPRDPAFFRAARHLLRALHCRGVAHNDLAKEANWIVRTDGTPAVLDFQLAMRGQRDSAWFRLLCREDLRHLLKHKRTYCPDRLTPIERRVLARRSWVARAWQRSGKQVYIFIARKILRWEDNEGRGRRRAG